MAKLEMEEKRYQREQEARLAAEAAANKKNQFSFDVPEDADISNPIVAFAKTMSEMQKQFACHIKKI
jgi:hypothetical protein